MDPRVQAALSILGYIALGAIACVVVLMACVFLLSSQISRQEAAQLITNPEVAATRNAQSDDEADASLRPCGLSFCLRGECGDFETCDHAEKRRKGGRQHG